MCTWPSLSAYPSISRSTAAAAFPSAACPALSKCRPSQALGSVTVAASKKLAPHYKQLAEEYGCGFLDAATVTEPSAWEGLHLDRAGHAALGKAAAAVLREMLG